MNGFDFPEYDRLDGIALAELVRAGEVTPLELLGAALERIDTRNGALNAVIHRLERQARAQCLAPLPDGPLSGVPILVKTSYFPNWTVHGATGPYRSTPNFMVVVPTSKDVRLTYGTTTAEWGGRILTLLGVAGIGALVWWGRRNRRGRPVG